MPTLTVPDVAGPGRRRPLARRRREQLADLPREPAQLRRPRRHARPVGVPAVLDARHGVADQRPDRPDPAAALAGRTAWGTTCPSSSRTRTCCSRRRSSTASSWPASITVSTVVFSSLAGFAFAKLRFRGRGRAAGARRPHDDGAGAARHRAALHAHGLARSRRPPAERHPAVPGQRVRRVPHAAVHDAGGAGRADRGRPRRRLLDAAHLLERRPARGAAGRRRARAVHVHAVLERVPLALHRPRPGRTRRCRSRSPGCPAATTPTSRW